MTSCKVDRTTWICQLKRDRGNLAWIVWNPNRKFQFNIPRIWGVQQVKDLSGKRSQVSDRAIEISPSPRLLEKLT